MTIRELRESIQTHLATITELSGVSCLIERDGTDQSEAEATALRAKGLVIYVQNMVGSLGSESQEGKLLKMDLAIPITLIENPTINLGDDGTGIPGENAIEIVARKLMGRATEFGHLKVSGDSFGRIEEGDGVVIHYFVVTAPWIMRPAW